MHWVEPSEAVNSGVSCDQMLAEARVRLVAGLKRYFHDKRGQGLLSGRGIVELDHACDAAMDRSDEPLSIWRVVERCVHKFALLPLSTPCTMQTGITSLRVPVHE